VAGRLFATVLFLAALNWVRAQAPAPAEVPFEYRNGLIWLRVSVAESPEQLSFVLDSGAGTSVVNLPTARRLRLKLGQAVSVRGVRSETGGYWPQPLSAKAGELPLPTEYLAVDLGQFSQACQCGVDGLLGADFFRKNVVEIDFKARKLRLLRSCSVTGAEAVVELKISRGAMLAAVGVNGRSPQWARLDTGCAAALHWVDGPGRRTSSRKTVSIGLAELALPRATTTVQLGRISFESVPTALHDSPVFAGEAGLLGNGLLARFDRVTIDAPAGRLVLFGSRPEGRIHAAATFHDQTRWNSSLR
jgi:hypothetical protein